MKSRHFWFELVAITIAAVLSVHAQVIIRGTESSDNSATRSDVNIATMDRNVVPLIKETKQTKVDASTERSDSVTRVRLNDGTYLDWQHSTTTTRTVAPGQKVSSTDVVVKDRQGNERISRRVDENVTRTVTGETEHTKLYARNSSGQLVLSQVVEANTVGAADGSSNTTRTVRVPDVDGRLVLSKQIQETAVDHGPNQRVITSTTRSVDHLNGQLAVTAEETTTITTLGATKQIDTVVRGPSRNGWEVTGGTTTTETTTPDGSIKRETIEQGRSLYSAKTGNNLMEPIVPQRKIVEQEVRKSDGTVVVQRDVFRRDVNGEWRPDSFSTKAAESNY